MEDHQTEAVEALKGSTLADVLAEEPAAIVVEERARPGEFAAPESPAGEDADDGQDEASSSGQAPRSAGDRPAGRRRRRRGRRGGGDRGPGGGAATKTP
jgi:hypothetical protein